MKYIENLKNKIGMNIIAICGWIYIYLLTDVIVNNTNYQNGEAFGLVFIFNIIECVILISFMIWLIELISNHKIKNNFINKNIAFYIFWMIGMTASLGFQVFLVYELIYNFLL